MCPPGTYCPQGGSAPIDCPSGTFGSSSGLSTSSCSGVCPTGTFCDAASVTPMSCSGGTPT
jgi:hypothetical protein